MRKVYPQHKNKTINKLYRPKKFYEKCFFRAWTTALTENAPVFNGLYGGLQRIIDGKAKKPEKIIREWCQRTHYKWDGQELEKLCQKYLLPLTKSQVSKRRCRKWAGLLLKAAVSAGITKDCEDKTVVLDEFNINAYVEWNGRELFLDDKVKIKTAAWYQEKRVIEQGFCIIAEDMEDKDD